MDRKGNIHEILSAGQKDDLEKKHGELVEIQQHELDDLKQMNRAQRREWYKKNKGRK